MRRSSGYILQCSRDFDDYKPDTQLMGKNVESEKEVRESTISRMMNLKKGGWWDSAGHSEVCKHHNIETDLTVLIMKWGNNKEREKAEGCKRDELVKLRRGNHGRSDFINWWIPILQANHTWPSVHLFCRQVSRFKFTEIIANCLRRKSTDGSCFSQPLRETGTHKLLSN